MTIDFHAPYKHYADHIRPIWDALPENERGRFYEDSRPPRSGDALVVAAYRDLARMKQKTRILVEHGIGQRYLGAHAGYPGGPRKPWDVYLTPNKDVGRNAPAEVQTFAVGTPKLDWAHRKFVNRGNSHRSATPVVAFSFHWDCGICPETSTSLWEYSRVISEFMDPSWLTIGHAHPRIAPDIEYLCGDAGVEFVPSFDDVLDRADVYVCDNSSTIFEFASCDKPVVLINGSHYRRGVNHGLRFWEDADVGIQVNTASELKSCISRALLDEDEVAARRLDIVDKLYAFRDGRATERAVSIIQEFTH